MESSSLLPLVPLGVVAALPLATTMPLDEVCSGEEVAEDKDPPEFSAEDEESPLDEVAVDVRIRVEWRGTALLKFPPAAPPPIEVSVGLPLIPRRW